MVLLAGLVGVVAGLGAVAFQFLSHLVLKYGLGFIAGYSRKGPTGEWSIFPDIQSIFGGFSPWLLLAVITAGGLISGFIVYTLAPEAEGHGTDAAIKAYHKGRGIIRPIVPLVKIVCSALTLGTGGSGGREGPMGHGTDIAMESAGITLVRGDLRGIANRQKFAALMAQGCKLVKEGDDKITLEVGLDSWPMPIPLVKVDGQWRFDTAAGKEEIINRHIGKDELHAIGVCRAYVAAQKQYAKPNPDARSTH